jgi:DNA-directed RNA polymerase subunit RPC12/RpoP
MSRANLRPCLSCGHVEIAKGFAVTCPNCGRRSSSTAQPIPPIPIAHEDAAGAACPRCSYKVTAPEQAARLGTDPIVLDARFLADLAELPGYAGHDF